MELILIILIVVAILAVIGALIARTVQNILIGIAIVALILAIIYFVSYTDFLYPQPDYNSTVITSPYVIKQIQGMNVTYPNESLTPGEVATDDLKMICDKYYSDLLVDVPKEIKVSIFSSYNVSQNTKAYVVDHKISLALGGSNTAKNVWPQPRKYPGYLEKDVVQRYLRERVCNHSMNLTEARNIITGDWYSVYLQIK